MSNRNGLLRDGEKLALKEAKEALVLQERRVRIMNMRHDKVAPSEDPITRFKRVWEGVSNSGTERLNGF